MTNIDDSQDIKSFFLDDMPTGLFNFANHFIELAKSEEKKLSTQMLMHMLYLAHSHCLDLRDCSLFENKIKITANGPMILDLYCMIGNPNSSDEYPVLSSSIKTETLSKFDAEFIDDVFQAYSHFSEDGLQRYERNKVSPYSLYEGGVNIPDWTIKEYYKSIRLEQKTMDFLSEQMEMRRQNKTQPAPIYPKGSLGETMSL